MTGKAGATCLSKEGGEALAIIVVWWHSCLVCAHTRVWTDPVFPLLHHGHKAALSDAGVL